MGKNRATIGMLAIVVGLAAIPGMGAALIGDGIQGEGQDTTLLQQSGSENGVNVSTNYPASNSSQAVDVTVTIAPTETEITNISIAIMDTENAFIDYDSFSISLDPSGAAEVEENLRSNGADQQKVYSINSLETDETVTITFQAYPRQLQSQDGTLNIARVNYEFLRNGIEVPDSGTGQIDAVTDISDSPQYEAQTLQSRINNMWITVGVSVAVGVIGLIAAVLLYMKNRNSGRSISRRRIRNIEDDIEDLQRRLSARGDEEGASKAEEIGDDLENLRR